MAIPVDAIVNALAPGIALTSGIFFANGLQTRYGLVSSRVRDLNREARELPPENTARRESLRWQVSLLNRRAEVTHRAILVSYVGLLAFITTIVLLLLASFFSLERLTFVTYGVFSVGLGCMGVAMLLSLGELRLSNETLVEDTRSSFADAPASGAAARDRRT